MSNKRTQRTIQIKALNTKLSKVCGEAAKFLDYSSCRVDLAHKRKEK